MPRKTKSFRATVFFIVLLSALFRIVPASAATTAVPQFTDLKNHWAASQITRLAVLGMVKGYKDRTYKPDQEISRLEALVLIVQSAGYSPGTGTKSAGSAKSGQSSKSTAGPQAPWGQPYLDLAIQKGFLSSPGKEFNFDAPASRLDIARLLGRVLLILPPVGAGTFTPESDSDQSTSPSVIKDISTLPAADRQIIATLVNDGIMNGYPDGTFRPYQAVSRAELAAIISRLIDLGRIQTNKGLRQVGWLSRVAFNQKTPELELTSLTGKKKYKLSTSALCFKNGVEWPISRAYGHRCEIILSGSQAGWINLLEQKEPAGKPEKLRGSVKSVLLGDENILVVNDLNSRDHTLPIAWDAILNTKKATNDFKTLKTGSFVDLKISRGQVKEVAPLDVKTLSDTVESVSANRLYLKSGGSKSKPGWINNWEFARIIDNNGKPIDNVLENDKVQITYLDPYPNEIDDEIPLEIKIIDKK